MTCGYDAKWTARRRTRLATLLAGYADGLPRGAGATDTKPAVRGRGRRAAAVRWSGRVWMDLTIADVTDSPEDAARPGRTGQNSSARRSTSTTSRPATARSAIRCSLPSGRATGGNNTR